MADVWTNLVQIQYVQKIQNKDGKMTATTIANTADLFNEQSFWHYHRQNATLRHQHQFHTNRSFPYLLWAFFHLFFSLGLLTSHHYWAIALWQCMHSIYMFFFHFFSTLKNMYVNLYCRPLNWASRFGWMSNVPVIVSRCCVCAFINFFKLSNFAFVLSLSMTMTMSWYPTSRALQTNIMSVSMLR